MLVLHLRRHSSEPIEGGQLPLVSTTYANDPQVAVTDPQNSAIGRINGNIEFFTRYQNNKVITLHKTHADAINNVNPITFASGQAGVVFNVYANKRRSPMRFDPGYTDATTTSGKWYIQCKDQSSEPQSVLNDNIFWRISQSDYSDRQRSTDMWYQRLEDRRDKDDRTYKLRFVIPEYLENARDPINGFVLKTRTDDTRKLVPQKVLLKPVVGSVYGARFQNPVDASEFIGDTTGSYDPFKKDQTGAGIEYRAFARFDSGIQATIQSGRRVADILDPNIEYLELTLFDHSVDTRNFPGLRNETFTTVKITSPQGGNFVTSKVDNQAADPNAISFAGNSSGLANVHAYYTVNGEHYLIIKNIRGGILEYSEYANTRFTQGTVFADMLEDQDMGKSLPLKTQIAKNNPEFFYKQNGANVYTITPGDRIQDDAGVEYYVDSVEDAGIIEDTFYIFGYETLQRRIAGQQPGIYYLTALRGNISPFPTGAGVTNNFKKFKFSQSVSKLYPLNYRNDPLWFKNSGTTQKEKDLYAALIDPPQAFSAADNYVHGLVTVNDFKNSTTREMVADLTEQPAFINNDYTIQAQKGNAASGSEQRLIPIGGNGAVSYTDKKYYVELRRPSIARAGNHTFEYLGFGPGNYSTGLPARQEVVLTPEEDFYAQSKKQDAGIVFYTGINSQGDLYIGNRRINAITGEETFIDQATLADDGDEDDVLDGLVTTFDTPVTFNQNITVVGGDGELVNTFESPITIAIQDEDLTQARDALIIRSNVSSVDPVTQLQQDEGLDRTAFAPPTEGDIRISKNKVRAAIFQFNARGNGQGYMFQTHTVAGVATNITPNQSPLIANGGSRINVAQFVNYGGVLAAPGDTLFKGGEVGKNGSIAWVLANYFAQISNNQIDNIEFDGTNVVKLSFRDFNSGVALSNTDIGITSSSQIRIKNFYYDPRLNLTWQVYASKPGDPFDPTNNYCHFQVIDQIPQDTQPWENIIAGTATGADEPTIEFSNANFKEVGVIGGEALRTETETIGNYKLGINTVARAPHSAYTNAWVNNLTTDPRANLDVVGTAFISGRTTGDFLDHTNFADRDKTAEDNALLVGGDSAAPNDEAVLRVATTNGGRVGINVDNSQLDRALVVDGTSRFTDDARFEHDIEVNGDDGTTAEIRTSQTTGNFNLVSDTTFNGNLSITAGVLDRNTSSGLYIGNSLKYVEIADATTDDQFIFIGNSTDHSNIFLGDIADTATNISKIRIGGAYGNNSSNSFTTFGNRRVNFAGDVTFGANKVLGGDRTNPENIVTLGTEAGIVKFFSGNTQTLDFATNASEINIGGQGGTTKIRNNLLVDASSRFNSSITLCGGFASFSFLGDRAQLGSTIISHASGILGANQYNQNIDIVNVLVVDVVDEANPTAAELTAGFNRIDTQGSDPWGDANYQSVVVGGGPEGADLPALTGDEFYLPVKYRPTPYFEALDRLIIDTAITGSTHPEIVQITEDGLAGAEQAPYYLKVRRQPLGTFTAIKENHPDTTNIWKINIAFDATWITQAIDGSGLQDNVYLSEFGGNLRPGIDYVIISREDTNNDGVDNQGEVVKVASLLDLVAKKFSVKNGCDTANEETVFEVDSTTGSVILGDPGNDNTTTFIYGNINFNGTCSDGTAGDTNTKLTFNNSLYKTAEIDICTGDAFFGSNYATIFAVGGFYGTTAAAHSTTDEVHVYRRDPFSVQANGPITTIFANVQTGTPSPSTVNIAVNDIDAFQKGDLVLITDGTNTKAEMVIVTDDPYEDGNGYKYLPTGSNSDYPSNEYPNGGRGAEGTTPQSWQANDIVVKLEKDPRTTTLGEAIPATGRIIVEAPNANPNKIRMKLVNGDLVSEKLDYEYIVRIGTELFWPDSIDGQNDSSFGVRLAKSVRNNDGSVTKFFGGGNLTTHGNLEITSGNIRMYGTDGRTLVFNVANDDGHPGDGAIVDPVTGKNGMYLNGFANIFGNLQVYNSQCQENGACSNELNFKVERATGSVDMGESLYIKGKLQETESASIPVLHIDNLGSAGTGGLAGPKDFIMYQDGSIDAFGISQYLNKNGGRRWTYVQASPTGLGQTVGNPLQPNNQYLVNLTTGGNMVVYLPSDAVTGDIIRFVELTGNLSYNTNLVIRALPINGNATAIQGDLQGTRLAAGSGSSLLVAPYDGGELVVQTRNAAFGLLFVGNTDAPNDPNASEIPTNLRGWWLVEL